MTPSRLTAQEARTPTLEQLEALLKFESDPAIRKFARQRYLDLTNPETRKEAA